MFSLVRMKDTHLTIAGPQTKYLEKQFNEAQSQLRDIVSLAFHLMIKLFSLITFSTSSIMLLSNSEIWLLYPLVLCPCNSYL